MEFQRERVYTAVNADELRAGDKVIVADSIADLKQFVIDQDVDELYEVDDESCEYRFIVEDGVGIVRYALAYLVERAENCTNCDKAGCYDCVSVQDPEAYRCEYYKPKTENRCATCAKSKNGGRGTCVLEEGYGCDDYEKKVDKAAAWFVKGLMDGSIERTSDETEKHYRPFKDTDELIEKWWKLNGWSKVEAKYKNDKLRMPLIWLKNKYNLCHISSLVTGFFDEKVIISGEKIESMEMLYADWVFPDGSPCGVKEQ